MQCVDALPSHCSVRACKHLLTIINSSHTWYLTRLSIQSCSNLLSQDKHSNPQISFRILPTFQGSKQPVWLGFFFSLQVQHGTQRSTCSLTRALQQSSIIFHDLYLILFTRHGILLALPPATYWIFISKVSTYCICGAEKSIYNTPCL